MHLCADSASSACTFAPTRRSGEVGGVDHEPLGVEDVARLEVSDEAKLAYLTQTTLSVDDANRIISKLKERFPQINSPPKDDICYATQNRQEAVAKLAPEAELTLVLGSQNSSNSQRLAELSAERGIPAYLIDGAENIHLDWFDGVNTVLVTAGASAPEIVVESGAAGCGVGADALKATGSAGGRTTQTIADRAGSTGS